MRVAVDGSALGRKHGIARYVHALLSRMVHEPGWDWLIHARRAPSDPALWGSNVEARADGLPAGIGDTLSLATSQATWLARDKPDLCWGPAHRLPLRIPSTTARVVTIHDLCWLKAPRTMRASTRWLDRMLMPRAVAQADIVIAVSLATRDAVGEAFPEAASRVVVVHEACEAMPAPQSCVVEPPYVLVVGTVEPRKNLARLFDAFARTPGNTRLVLAGAPGWGVDAPEKMASRAGIEERFTYLGAVDDATLASLYANAEFLAMPSLYEGFGLPILEALAHGTPVVHGNNSSMPEVAGDAGLGVEAESVDSIATGLIRLLTDESLRSTLAARAKAHAEKFSWDRAAGETLAVFEEAIALRQTRKA